MYPFKKSYKPNLYKVVQKEKDFVLYSYTTIIKTISNQYTIIIYDYIQEYTPKASLHTSNRGWERGIGPENENIVTLKDVYLYEVGYAAFTPSSFKFSTFTQDNIITSIPTDSITEVVTTKALHETVTKTIDVLELI
jgi:hypothetical protein